MLVKLVFVFIVASALVVPVVVVGLIFVGGPSMDETCDGRAVVISAAGTAAFDTKWDTFDAALDAGTPSTVSFNESEITSRAETFLLENDVDVEGLLVCLRSGEGEAVGEFDFPILPGGVRARIRGTVDLSGSSPELDVTDFDVGSVPGFFANLARGAITGAAQDALDDLDLEHGLNLTLSDNEAALDGTP